MSELVFPVAAIAVVFLGVIPALSLIARGAMARRRRRIATWGDFGSASTFAWLVAPTVAPLLWLLSSAWHQSEPWREAASCLTRHASASECQDALILFVALLVATGGAIAWRLRRDRFTPRLMASTDEAAQHLARLVAADPRLARLRPRVVRRAPAPIFTVGWLRPRTLIDACFIRDVDAAALHAALLHELAHAAARDTLRDSLVRFALALNPARGLLQADFARWRQAREAQCDAVAVQAGGAPLALAHGLVRAARFQCRAIPRGASLLCGHRHGLAALQLRVHLLLNGAPAPRRSRGHLALALLIAAAVLVPHLSATGLLDAFHVAVERLIHGGA